MGSCAPCEVTWKGDDPCWVCGQASTGRFGWASHVTPSPEQKNPLALPLQASGRVQGWEQRSPWAAFVREQLAARLPWLRLESGSVDSLAVWLGCLLSLVFVVVIAAVSR